MDRTLVLDYHAAIPVGNRVEVRERDGLFAVTDLDTGIRYVPTGTPSAQADTAWQGRVRSCQVANVDGRDRTTLVVSADTVSGPSAEESAHASPAQEALEALDGADAAFAAALAEARRWSSTPVQPVQPEWRG